MLVKIAYDVTEQPWAREWKEALAVGRIDHRPEILHRALNLACRTFRILHRKCGDPLKSVGSLRDFLSQKVIRPLSEICRHYRIEDALDRGRIERKDHHLDPMLVHEPETPVVKVDHTAAKFIPELLWELTDWVFKGFVEGEVLLDCDLAAHGHFSLRCFPIQHRLA